MVKMVIGAYYKCADGKIVGPLTKYYALYQVIDSKNGHFAIYDSTGKRTFGDFCDLVEMVDNPNETKNIKMVVGAYYKTEQGKIVGPLFVLRGGYGIKYQGGYCCYYDINGKTTDYYGFNLVEMVDNPNETKSSSNDETVSYIVSINTKNHTDNQVLSFKSEEEAKVFLEWINQQKQYKGNTKIGTDNVIHTAGSAIDFIRSKFES